MMAIGPPTLIIRAKAGQKLAGWWLYELNKYAAFATNVEFSAELVW